MPSVQFSIDAPGGNEIGRISRLSGWGFDGNGEPPLAIRIGINNSDYLSLAHCIRQDVGLAFPDIPKAALSGFVGDLVVPFSIKADDRIRVSITAFFKSAKLQLLNRSFRVAERDLPDNKRCRSYDLVSLLEHPLTGQRISPDRIGSSGIEDWTAGCSVAGTFHFHPVENLPIIRLTETGPTHPYSAKARKLIESSDLFLDFGAGIRCDDDLFGHGVFLDAVHFRNIDVVNSFPTLPFRSNVFDVVISQAVFEHLPDPFFAAQEIKRVLKPKGYLLIDTAFMQPLHADPSHYFNMTQAGLTRILQGFRIEEIGIQPYQWPSFGLMMQLEAVLPFMQKGKWKKRLQNFLRQLKEEGDEFNAALGTVGREILAAGVFALARKP